MSPDAFDNLSNKLWPSIACSSLQYRNSTFENNSFFQRWCCNLDFVISRDIWLKLFLNDLDHATDNNWSYDVQIKLAKYEDLHNGTAKRAKKFNSLGLINGHVGTLLVVLHWQILWTHNSADNFSGIIKCLNSIVKKCMDQIQQRVGQMIE